MYEPPARIRRLNHGVVALTGSEDCRAFGVHEPEANPLTLRYVERLWILWESTVDQEGALTVGFYVLGRVGIMTAFTRPIYLLVAFGQLWDGAQNLVGTALFGYESKMFLTHTIYNLTGISASTFLLKLGLVPLVVWILADSEGEMDHVWWWILVVAVIVVGLPMGVRGSLRMMLGV